jgi:hypothetical protein
VSPRHASTVTRRGLRSPWVRSTLARQGRQRSGIRHAQRGHGHCDATCRVHLPGDHDAHAVRRLHPVPARA